jgi:integration host factor subunit beta
MNGETQQAARRVGRTRSSKAFLTKAGLIEEVSQVTQTTGKTAKAMVEAIIESMVLAVRSGNTVEIRGFGSFRTRARRPRIGRNPKTGVAVEIPAKRIAFFTPGRKLRELLARIPQ